MVRKYRVNHQKITNYANHCFEKLERKQEPIPYNAHISARHKGTELIAVGRNLNFKNNKHLRSGRFQGSVFDGSDFSGANLRDTDFSYASLRCCNFIGVDIGWNPNFTDAKIEGALFIDAEVPPENPDYLATLRTQGAITSIDQFISSFREEKLQPHLMYFHAAYQLSEKYPKHHDVLMEIVRWCMEQPEIKIQAAAHAIPYFRRNPLDTSTLPELSNFPGHVRFHILLPRAREEFKDLALLNDEEISNIYNASKNKSLLSKDELANAAKEIPEGTKYREGKIRDLAMNRKLASVLGLKR